MILSILKRAAIIVISLLGSVLLFEPSVTNRMEVIWRGRSAQFVGLDKRVGRNPPKTDTTKVGNFMM